jgi:hypothetical protein
MDLLLSDIGKMEWASKLRSQALRCIVFIINHQWSQALIRKYSKDGSKLELKRPGVQQTADHVVCGAVYTAVSRRLSTRLLRDPCAVRHAGDTRFASVCIMLERLLAMRRDLENTVADAAWGKHEEGGRYAERAAEVRRVVQKSSFWGRVSKLAQLMQPIVAVLRLADGNQPSMGSIYAAMLKLELGFGVLSADKDSFLSSAVLDKVEAMHTDRWTWVDSPLHSAGFLLDPQHHSLARALRHLASSPDTQAKAVELPGLTQQRAMELQLALDKGFADVATAVLSKVTGGAGQAVEQLSKLFSPTGIIFSELAINARTTMAGWRWWDVYGMPLPQMRMIAMRVLACVASSSACERNWSDFGFIHSKKRNKLSTTQLEKLVYVFSNVRMMDEVQEGAVGGTAIPWLQAPALAADEACESEAESSCSESEGDEEAVEVSDGSDDD